MYICMRMNVYMCSCGNNLLASWLLNLADQDCAKNAPDGKSSNIKDKTGHI